MKIRQVILALAITLMCSPNLALADDVWNMAQSEKYGRKMGGMLGRGFINVATCFVDLLVQTVEGTKSGPPFVGTLTGLGSGLGCTALRVSSGAVDVLTFWVPGFNGFPISRSYSNCIEAIPTSAAQENYAAPAADEQTYVAPQEEPRVATGQADAMRYVKK